MRDGSFEPFKLGAQIGGGIGTTEYGGTGCDEDTGCGVAFNLTKK